LWFGASAVLTPLCGNAALVCWETALAASEHLIELGGRPQRDREQLPGLPDPDAHPRHGYLDRMVGPVPCPAGPAHHAGRAARPRLLGQVSDVLRDPGASRPCDAVFAALGVDTATIVGHATGGSVATALAEQKPELLKDVGHTSMLDDPQRAGDRLREFAHRASNRRSTR
jgi:hypothetical protein